MRNIYFKFGQGMIEYILLFAVVIIIIIAALRPSGLLTTAVNKVIDDATQEVVDMAVCINFCGDGPCPAVARNNCCEPGEDDPSSPTYDPVDCEGCVPVGCLLGDCRFKSDGCNQTIDCGPCPCINQTESTLCGSVVLTGGPSGTVRVLACPAGCINNVQGVCTDGTWSVTNNCIETPCAPLTGINTACGPVSLPASSSGTTAVAACPNGCGGGDVRSLCYRGSWGAISDTCVITSCLASSPFTISPCGGTVSFPQAPVNSTFNISCPPTCNSSGNVTGACAANGTWSIQSNPCCITQNGGWSAPSTVTSACSAGNQTTTTTRTCTNPSPSCGGTNCVCAPGVSSCTGNPLVETTVAAVSCCGNGFIDSGENCVTCRADVGDCAGTGCGSCPLGNYRSFQFVYFGTSDYFSCVESGAYSTFQFNSAGTWCSDYLCTGASSYVGALCYSETYTINQYGVKTVSASANHQWRFR